MSSGSDFGDSGGLFGDAGGTFGGFWTDEPAGIAPTLTFEIAFGQTPFDATVWTDVTTSMRNAFTITYGRSSETDAPTCATFDGELIDYDRRYDPLNTSSPYNGQLRPYVPFRVTARYAGIDYPLYYGLIESWPQGYVTANNYTSVAVHATCLLSWLARTGWTPANPWTLNDSTAGRLGATSVLSAGTTPTLDRDRSGVRIAKWLGLIGVPASQQDIEPGNSYCLSAPVAETTLLDHFAKVEQVELGRLHSTPEGTFQFVGRRTTNERMTNVQAIWRSDGTGGRYTALELDPADFRTFTNEATRGNDTVGVAYRFDQTSIDQFGKASSDVTDLPFDSYRAADSQAAYVVRTFSQPRARVKSLQVAAGRDPANLFPVLLGTRLGDLHQVVHQPLGVGSTFTQAARVEQYTHEVAEGGRFWSTTCALTEPDLTAYWQLNNSATPLGAAELAY